MTAAVDQDVSGCQDPDQAVASTGQGRALLTVNQVVAAAVLLGTAAAVTAFVLVDARAAAFELSWLDRPWLHLVLLTMTCLCMVERVGVRLRHDDDGNAQEELTLLDGAVLLSTLLLPLRDVLLLTLVGILIAYLARRLDPLKLAYNLGVYATASTAMAVLVHFIVPARAAFDARLVLAMFVAAAAFVAINLVHMALLLSAIANERPVDVLRSDARLSLLTVIGTVGLTGSVLAMSVATPVLLPCAVLPAIALRFGYGATAAEHEERRRSTRVLAYSQVLASGPSRSTAITAFLQMLRQEFDATAVLMVFADGTAVTVDRATAEAGPVSVPEGLRRLLETSQLQIADTGLPHGWASAMTAPVTVDGQRIGAAVVAGGGRTRFHPRDLTTLSSLVASFAVALQNADHMVQLVDETSKLRAVVNQAGDGIVVLGPDGVIEIWSPAMVRTTGVSERDAIGTRLRELITVEAGPEEPNPLEEAERRLSPETPQCTVDIVVVRPDGERKDARFSHAAVFDAGELVRDVVIVRDLSAERRVQRMKSDFIATVSHELRTPLTPIKGYATMLRKRADTMPPEKRDRALDVIVDRAEHLGRLVEDLLAASSITADQGPRHSLTTDRAELFALAVRAGEDFPAAAGRLHVRPAGRPVQVLGDPTRVVQITSNLISNALKYSPPDQPVHVTVEQRHATGYLTVVDRGLGIPADQLEHVFDKFHRVEDPMVMSTGGTGLGLYIARQLARAMGGDITTESTLGAGSAFTLTLPLATDDAVGDRSGLGMSG